MVTAESPRPVRRTNSESVIAPCAGIASSPISSLNQISVPVGGMASIGRSAAGAPLFGAGRRERGVDISTGSADHRGCGGLAPAGRAGDRSREVDGNAAPSDGPSKQWCRPSVFGVTKGDASPGRPQRTDSMRGGQAMRRATFEVTVSQSKTALDLQLLTRLLAASAVRQHLAAAKSDRRGGDGEDSPS